MDHPDDLHPSRLPMRLLARFAAVNQLYVVVARESDAGLARKLNMAVDCRIEEMRALGAAYATPAGTGGDRGDGGVWLSAGIDRGAGLARALARAEQLLQEMLVRAIEPITGDHPAHGQLRRSHEASVRWRNDLVFHGLNADPTATLVQTVDEVFMPRPRQRRPGRRAAR